MLVKHKTNRFFFLVVFLFIQNIIQVHGLPVVVIASLKFQVKYKKYSLLEQRRCKVHSRYYWLKLVFGFGKGYIWDG